ncbi:MAG TPA: hypothetical protein VKZ60_03990 [Chloroflexota bacterium]|jgi:hypothetical protein|nr:hypothetical protein [Chloroflexota bacterium]
MKVTVIALISDPVQVAHAQQKLRALGIAPGAMQAIAHDPAAARALVRRGAGERALGVVTGALLGLLLGGAAGWMLGGSIDLLRGPTNGTISGPGPTALVGLGVGLVLGLLVGWGLGALLQRRYVQGCLADLAAGDTLLAVEIGPERLREVEALLASYGGRRIRSRPGSLGAGNRTTA